MRKLIAVTIVLVMSLSILVPNIVIASNEIEQNIKNNNVTVEKNTIEENKIEENIENSTNENNENIKTENETTDNIKNEVENNINEENNHKQEEKNEIVEEIENNQNITNQETLEKIETENIIDESLISYKSHVQDEGWQNYVKDGEISGTTGKSRRVEAIQIALGNSPELSEGASVKYQVHVQDYGWMGWKNNGEVAGTEGKAKRVEAIQIKLEGLKGYSVIYRTHVQDIGWTGWVTNGEISGTEGKAKRIEAIQIKIVKNPEIKVEYIYNENSNTVTAQIKSSKQLGNINDSDWNLSTDKLLYSKEYKENENYNIVVTDIDGVKTQLNIKITDIKEPISMIKYSSHIQINGWEKNLSKKDGEISGTESQAKRIEAIQIALGNSPEFSGGASVKYQVHAQEYGWMGWKKDGEIAGTVGEAKRIEAIKIQLEGLEGYSVIYRTHVQDIGWTAWVNNGEISGTEGRAKRIEAIQIKIVKNPEIKVEYIYNKSNNTVTAQIKSSKELRNINDSNWNLSEDKLTYSKDYDINDIYNVNIEDIDGIKVSVQINITDVVEPTSMIKYSSHVQFDGWERKYSKIDGDISGKTGEGKRLEAIQIALGNSIEISEGASIKYQVHVQDYGWMGWKKDGEIAGTVGEERRIEAIQIKLEGLKGYCVEYRTYIQDTGWQKWKSDGEISGTIEQAKRIEAIQIRVVKEENKIIEPSIEYQAYIQKDGWQEKVVEDTIVGEIGTGKGIKALKINLAGATNNSSIKYNVYTEDGWQNWSDTDKITNISEKDKNIKKLQIKLENLEGYSIEYRVYISGYGWQKWRKDGEIAGETKNDIEAIQARIVYDTSVLIEPEVSYQAYVQEDGWQEETIEGFLAGTEQQEKRLEAIKINLLDGNPNQKIIYRTHIQDSGWQPWVRNGAVSGTTGQNKRIEAIQIKLEGMENYTVEYQVHIQEYGWSDWMIDGETAGTTGEAKRIEAIKIRIVPKYYRNYKGIDVSEHNGLIDWQSVKNSGVQFAMIRCAYRGYRNPVIVKDAYFDYNVRNAAAVGIKVGIYFFSQATSIAEAVEEANYAINLAKSYGCISYPIAIDTESSGAENNDGRADGLDVGLRTNVVAAFCNQVNSAGYTPMVYASRDWLYNNLEVTRLSIYETWLAHYTNNPENKSDYKYDYTMWQYTSGGSIPGISGRTDLNIGYKRY